jgi:hypothetical protein
VAIVQATLVAGAQYSELARLRIDRYRAGTLPICNSESSKARRVALGSDGRGLFD